MMHPEVEDFLKSPTIEAMPWLHARVVEIGAQNVNGPTRSLVPAGWDTWVGIDLIDGPGVDHVGDAAMVLTGLAMHHEQFDIAVATEVFEHDAGWPWIVKGMVDVLRPGGHLLITCAAPGRPSHGVSGAAEPEPGEHYANVALETLSAVVWQFGCRMVFGYQRAEWPQDTYLVAVKP